MYKIRPFLIYDIEIGTVFQNGLNTVVVKNKEVIELLKDLDKGKELEISEEKLKSYFPNNFEAALKFILNNNIIYEEIKPVFSFKDLHVYSNCDAFKTTLDFFIKDIDFFEKKEIHDLENYNYLPKKDDLAIIFLNPFELGEFKNVVDKFKETGCVVKFIFYYNNSIYISNYYKPEWKNPCPKCFFYSLEAQLRSYGQNPEYLNFQTLVDMFSAKEIKFKSEALLKPHNFIGVMDALFNQFKNINNFNAIVNEVWEISVETTYTNTDYCYHFDMCDCYE